MAKVEQLSFKHFMGNCKTSKQFNRFTSPFGGISKTELSFSLLTDGQAQHSSIRNQLVIKESILPQSRGDKVLQIPSPNILSPQSSPCHCKGICLPLSAAGYVEYRGRKGNLHFMCMWGQRTPSRRICPVPGAELSHHTHRNSRIGEKNGRMGKKCVSLILVLGNLP